MSNRYYNDIWHGTQLEIDFLAAADLDRQNQDTAVSIGGSHASLLMQSRTYELYLRYICSANKLEEVYDKLLQPQKRLLVRRLLDACLGRIVELKHDLVNIDLMEFSYNDAVMERLQLTPMDTELRIPRYFLRERAQELTQRQQRMHEILTKLGWTEECQAEERPTELDAIRLIQIHERARQGRLRAHFMKEIRMLKDKSKSAEERGREDSDTGLIAAMRIQKMWRGHAARQRTRRRKIEEMILIGMLPPPLQQQKQMLQRKSRLDQLYEQRYKLQQAYEQKFKAQLELVREEIKTKHGVTLMEDMGDEIRAWVKDYYDKTGKLPEFPSEDQGGSLHLFSRPGTESELSRSSARSSKESRKTKDKSKSPARSGDLNVAENQAEGKDFQPGPSMFLPEIKNEIEEFKEVWQHKDETLNFQQNIYSDMVYAEKYREVECELRRIVDEVMRQELELLQASLGKKAKKAAKKPRRSSKKSKKKKEKDLTPDRTTDSLFEELITNGIIRKYTEVRLCQYLGDKALTARHGTNPSPGDIRQVITEYCILPLGSEQIRHQCPLIRSMLLAGPKRSGKKALVHAICNEVGAVLFDLTPANIVGKYPGKSGLIMLIHLVLKVARLLQPSVIFMGDAERPFMKKVPKTDRTDPKRLKKDLPRLIKNIAFEDRILFIGTSHLPWEADQKLLQQTYNRFIYIPRPDYGALSFAWKALLNEHSGGLATLDTSGMARISDGYTIGQVDACIKDVLTCKRKLQLRTHPLTNEELINALSTRDPVYREEQEAFENWWSKTPLGRRKQRALEMEEEAKLEQEAQSAKQRNGKKTA